MVVGDITPWLMGVSLIVHTRMCVSGSLQLSYYLQFQNTHTHTFVSSVSQPPSKMNTRTQLQLFSHHAGILVGDLLLNVVCIVRLGKKNHKNLEKFYHDIRANISPWLYKFLFGPFCELRGYSIRKWLKSFSLGVSHDSESHHRSCFQINRAWVNNLQRNGQI